METQAPLAILVVSDNAVLAEALAERFAREPGLEVRRASGRAAEIQQALRRRRPDLLLLDLDGVGPLPEDLLTRLRRQWSDLRILVLAPRADERVVARVLRHGANGVLGRDEGLTELFRAIETVALGQSWAGRRAVARALEKLPRARERQGPALTPRERQVLGLLADGYRNKELATLLQIKEQTVKIHLHSLFRKLNVRSRLEAALRAAELA